VVGAPQPRQAMSLVQVLAVDYLHGFYPDPFAFLLGRFLAPEVQDKRTVLVGENPQVQAAFARL
jgi:hypothetical protein